MLKIDKVPILTFTNLMATAKKKKTKSIGQVSYLTKQVASLEKDLIRKDIEKLDQKVDGVKTELITKADNLETKLNTKIDSVKTELKQDIKHLKSNNKIILGILSVGFTALFTAIFYLHSDTKQDINSINTKLDRLIERDLRK